MTVEVVWREVVAEMLEEEEEAKAVKLYDSKHPDSFSKDEIRTRQMLHTTSTITREAVKIGE